MAPQIDDEPDQDIAELYEGRNWQLIQRIVAGVILLLIIGFLVWYLFFRNTSSSTPTVPPSPSQGQIKNQPAGGTSNSPSGGSNGQANSGQAQPSPSSTGSGQNLTNTGPGDVIAIFAGAVAIGTLAYRLKLRRQN